MNTFLMAIALSISVAFTTLITVAAPNSQTATNDADRAYIELQEASSLPSRPQEWNVKPPSAEERVMFNRFVRDRALRARIKSNDFVAKYPSDPRVADAKENALRMQEIVIQMGKAIPPANYFDEKVRQVQMAAVRQVGDGHIIDPAALERGLLELQKEFPREPKLYDLLLALAQHIHEGPAKKVLADIAASPIAGRETKFRAAALLKQLNRVGTRLEMKFTSVQGQPVDVSQLRGKVVLIDFWATWCPPCIKALPGLKEDYVKYHPKGFEIIGISLDSKAAKLTSFIQDEGMTWPQHFDGKEWENKFAQEFDINSVPSMWLIDKKGIVRDVRAGPGLSRKIEALLAEP